MAANMRRENLRKLDTAKEATMDLVALNNTVVTMRSVVKATKVQVIRKLSRMIRKLKKKKGTEEQKQKNLRKAQRMLDEIFVIKGLNADIVTKFALANKTTFRDVCKQSSARPEVRSVLRLVEHRPLADKVKAFRTGHADWEELAAYLTTKQTGRRFKTKEQKMRAAHRGSRFLDLDALAALGGDGAGQDAPQTSAFALRLRADVTGTDEDGGGEQTGADQEQTGVDEKEMSSVAEKHASVDQNQTDVNSRRTVVDKNETVFDKKSSKADRKQMNADKKKQTKAGNRKKLEKGESESITEDYRGTARQEQTNRTAEEEEEEEEEEDAQSSDGSCDVLRSDGKNSDAEMVVDDDDDDDDDDDGMDVGENSEGEAADTGSSASEDSDRTHSDSDAVEDDNNDGGDSGSRQDSDSDDDSGQHHNIDGDSDTESETAHDQHNSESAEDSDSHMSHDDDDEEEEASDDDSDRYSGSDNDAEFQGRVKSQSDALSMLRKAPATSALVEDPFFMGDPASEDADAPHHWIEEDTVKKMESTQERRGGPSWRGRGRGQRPSRGGHFEAQPWRDPDDRWLKGDRQQRGRGRGRGWDHRGQRGRGTFSARGGPSRGRSGEGQGYRGEGRGHSVQGREKGWRNEDSDSRSFRHGHPKDSFRGRGRGKDGFRGRGRKDNFRGHGGKDSVRGHGGKDSFRGQGHKEKSSHQQGSKRQERTDGGSRPVEDPSSHPSWEAHRKRKMMEKTATFSGKHVKFDD